MYLFLRQKPHYDYLLATRREKSKGDLAQDGRGVGEEMVKVSATTKKPKKVQKFYLYESLRVMSEFPHKKPTT